MSRDWLKLPSRAVEKFGMATRHLAISPDPLHERLGVALRELMTLRPDEFPEEETQARWQVIRDRIDREPALPDGRINNAIAGMNEEDAVKLAAEIYSITILLRDLQAGLYEPPRDRAPGRDMP